jgi:pectate lyase
MTMLLLSGLSFFLSAQDAGMFRVAGFATVEGNLTGGAGGDTVWVHSGTELQDAIKEKEDLPAPRVIMVEGTITLDNSPGLSKIDVKDVDDMTILGAGTGAEFDGIGLKIRRASNIILRNLKVHHVLSGEKDCLGIEGPADHIWIDHCELFNEFEGVEKDYYDGLLDAKADCEYLTYSWNYLHDSWKTALVGSSEGDTHDRKLTMHHNWFRNCNSRIPLFRASTGHFFNNYYVDIASTAINSRIGACARIENNYFKNTLNPWVSAYSDVLGGGEVMGNYLENSPFVYSEDTHELPACEAVIPYDYADILHDAEEIPVLVMQYAGVGKLGVATGWETVRVEGEDPGNPMVYPNPVRGHSILSFVVPGEGLMKVSLIGVSGTRTLIHEGIGRKGAVRQLPFDGGRFPAGIYLVEVRTTGARSLGKIAISP